MGYLSIILAKDVRNLTNLMEKRLTNILSRSSNSDGYNGSRYIYKYLFTYIWTKYFMLNYFYYLFIEMLTYG